MSSAFDDRDPTWFRVLKVAFWLIIVALSALALLWITMGVTTMLVTT